jgi:UDP-glucose 4-epimerase
VAASLVWVIGRRGLLGASVAAAIGDTWRPQQASFAWHQPQQLDLDLRQAVREFVAAVSAARPASWTVCWCAGVGAVGSSPAALQAETAAFRRFLTTLGAEPRLSAVPGRFFLASSAGGVHAGSTDRPITESSAPRPISPYGRAKLEQEEALAAWLASRPHIRTLVGRFANLYGPGQSLHKGQGLISHIARCAVFRVPVHIYVSLDTIRDYLFADDAGRRVAYGLRRLDQRSPTGSPPLIKLYGSEREISIAGVLGIFFRIARQQMRVVLGMHPTSGRQPAQLQFRSTLWRGQEPPPRIELVEGITRVFQHNLSLFQAGRLPPPPEIAYVRK